MRSRLAATVKTAKEEKLGDVNFIIRGERNVAYRDIESLLNLCRDESVRNVTFSALQGEGGA